MNSVKKRNYVITSGRKQKFNADVEFLRINRGKKSPLQHLHNRVIMSPTLKVTLVANKRKMNLSRDGSEKLGAKEAAKVGHTALPSNLQCKCVPTSGLARSSRIEPRPYGFNRSLLVVAKSDYYLTNVKAENLPKEYWTLCDKCVETPEQENITRGSTDPLSAFAKVTESTSHEQAKSKL